MIKAVLFDLDGTLINTNELIIESFQHAFREHFKKEISREEVILTFGEPLRGAMLKYDENNVDEMLSIFRKHNESRHDELAEEYDGVYDGIIKLKEMGIKIALVTSKRKKMTERGLRLVRIYDLMDAVVTPEDTDKHKPFGEPAVKACEILGIVPSQAIMVGDSHNDILCGKDAGTLTCLVSYTALPLEKMMSYGPDFIIDNVMELVDICNNLNKN